MRKEVPFFFIRVYLWSILAVDIYRRLSAFICG